MHWGYGSKKKQPSLSNSWNLYSPFIDEIFVGTSAWQCHSDATCWEDSGKGHRQDLLDLQSWWINTCMLSHFICVWLCDPVTLQTLQTGSSVHGILQARILKWVAMPSSRRSSLPRDQTHISYVSCIGREVLYHWAIREALDLGRANIKIKLVEVFMTVAGIFVNCLGLHYIIWELKFCFIWCLFFFTEYIIYLTCSN